jgi:hypothetical protein
MKWTSNAKWTKISDSQDIHESKEAAQAVCNALMDTYGERLGKECPIRGFCLEAWYEEESPK